MMSGNFSANFSVDYFQYLEDSFPFFMALFICYLLLLPVFVFVLYIGFQRWKTRRSGLKAESMSHSDIFTFNIVAFELISVLGSCFYCCSFYTRRLILMSVGIGLFMINLPGQSLFHALTCAERYLAVVHPVTYRGLKQSRGVWIRNIIVGCVWLICLGSLGLTQFLTLWFSINILIFLVSSVVIFYCSLSALCVLIRPGPGEVGGNKERVDHLKQRAFHTIGAITGALLLRFLTMVVNPLQQLNPNLGDRFMVVWSLGWLYVPGSLVLPLLFLHRAGKLQGRKQNPESG